MPLPSAITVLFCLLILYIYFFSNMNRENFVQDRLPRFLQYVQSSYLLQNFFPIRRRNPKTAICSWFSKLNSVNCLYMFDNDKISSRVDQDASERRNQINKFLLLMYTNSAEDLYHALVKTIHSKQLVDRSISTDN